MGAWGLGPTAVALSIHGPGNDYVAAHRNKFGFAGYEVELFNQ